MDKKKKVFSIVLGIMLVISFLSGSLIMYFTMDTGMDIESMDMDMKRETFISLKEDIQKEHLMNGDFKCCLNKPCTYCIEKSPGHGEDATCSCLEDIMEGKHPCGECIGEILEGHGNPLISEYFARAIAEKTGQEDAIKKIIEEKYNIPVEEQI